MRKYGLIIYNTGKKFPIFVDNEEELDELFDNIIKLVKDKNCLAYTIVEQDFKILLTSEFIKNSHLVFTKNIEKDLK